MKVIYDGSLKLKYDKNKYNNFDEYIKFKESIDLLFEKENIQLEKIPENPTLKFYVVFYSFIIEYQSDKFKSFMNKLEGLNLRDKVVYYLKFKYTKKEINEAPLLEMATHYDFYATNIKHPSEYGTKYKKIFVCPKCGSVEYEQISELHWNTTQMKKKLFLEIPDDRHYGGYAIIITEQLANILKSENFTGYSLEPVIHVGNKDKEKKCYQMIVNSIMPPLSEKMPIIFTDEDCREPHNKYGRILYPLHYDKSSLDKIEDFNFSLEKSVFRGQQPMLLVSQRVKTLFATLRIKPVYEPIIVVE